MEKRNKVYKVTFGFRDMLNYSSVNVLASDAKEAIRRAEPQKQSNWYVVSVEMLAAADY
jgi:hypothetical protein